jgi:hypothetical protein
MDSEDEDECVDEEDMTEISIGATNGPHFGRQNGIIFVDASGIYKRSVRWCLCPNAPPVHIQLFRMRFFPASFKRPSTAFTFRVLDQFHVEAMECKISAHNFYSKLQRITNNSHPLLVSVYLYPPIVSLII